MIPNFIIAGAEKSGTSSLAFLLSQHSDIFMPAQKELHFFENDQNFEKGISWYQEQFQGQLSESAVGECTPLYMYDPRAAERIHSLLPDIKLLFILRNPADRAYSNYWHQVRGGKEYCSFATALRREAKRRRKGIRYDFMYSYTAKGLYCDLLERFTGRFGPDRLLIVTFEDYKNHTEHTLNRICQFLGVFPFKGPMEWETVKNKSIVPKFPFLQVAARFFLGGSVFFRGIAKVNLWLGGSDYPDMPPDIRAKLVNYFLHDIDRLEKITGMDLSEWKQ